jgi:hypothetical protein
MGIVEFGLVVGGSLGGFGATFGMAGMGLVVFVAGIEVMFAGWTDCVILLVVSADFTLGSELRTVKLLGAGACAFCWATGGDVPVPKFCPFWKTPNFHSPKSIPTVNNATASRITATMQQILPPEVLDLVMGALSADLLES